MSVVPLKGINAPTEQERELTADPKELRRMSADPNSAHTGLQQRLWGLQARLAPNVSFEEFHYWAKVERELEVSNHECKPNCECFVKMATL